MLYSHVQGGVYDSHVQGGVYDSHVQGASSGDLWMMGRKKLNSPSVISTDASTGRGSRSTGATMDTRTGITSPGARLGSEIELTACHAAAPTRLSTAPSPQGWVE